MSEHAVLSPSSAHRWSLCAGAIKASLNVPNPTTEDSARGTVKHWAGEQCLTDGTDAEAYRGRTLSEGAFSFVVDSEFIRQVQSYVDGVRRVPGRKFYEVRLDTSSILGVPDQFGSADAIILNSDARQLEVHDAKFGFNKVLAQGNKQGLIYGAAALERYYWYADWETVKFVIHQPPIAHYDDAIYTIDQVRAFLDEIRPQAARAYAMYQGTLPIELTPGPTQCEWCPIRGTCKKRGDRIMNMFPVGFQDDEPEAPLLSDAEVGAAMTQLDEIEGWCSDIRKEAYTRARAGRKIPGQKLVKGNKSARFWKDPKKAEAQLGLLIDPEVMYAPRELVSPTQIEERVGRKTYETLKSLVDQNEGALRLVPESDNKPEVIVSTLEFNNTPGDSNGLI